jgi:hypothetical protein
VGEGAVVDVQSVDDSGDVTEDGEEDVDEEVGAAAALEEDSDGGEEDGEDDLADVAGVGVSLGFRVRRRRVASIAAVWAW